MSRRGAWALSGLVAERCGVRRRASVRASAWLELVAGLGQVDRGGEAVLCLMPPRPPLRLAAVMAAVAILLAVVFVIRPAVVAGGGGPVVRRGWWVAPGR